jgi:hypothetical protein
MSSDVTPEIDLVTLSADEWDALRAAAAELDLVRGGYYRARPGAILCYAGPENAPEGWASGFPDGSPELPRAHVGAAELVDAGDLDRVLLRLTVANWAAARSVQGVGEAAETAIGYRAFVLAQEAALRGRPEERAWLRRQFERLRRHAAGGLVDPP